MKNYLPKFDSTKNWAFSDDKYLKYKNANENDSTKKRSCLPPNSLGPQANPEESQRIKLCKDLKDNFWKEFDSLFVLCDSAKKIPTTNKAKSNPIGATRPGDGSSHAEGTVPASP